MLSVLIGTIVNAQEYDSADLKHHEHCSIMLILMKFGYLEQLNVA